METDEFVLQASIDTETLEAWLEAGWLAPRNINGDVDYGSVDVARAHLIHDLKELGINDEGVPVILGLIDQLHGVRRLLRELLSAARVQQSQE